MQIKLLKDCQQYIPELAENLFTLWENDYIKLMNIHNVKELEHHLEKKLSNSNHILPHAYVLINDDDLDMIGFGVLEYNDAVKSDTLLNNPKMIWLTSLYIKPEYRKQRIGTVFIDYLCNKIKYLYNFNNLLIWTNKEDVINFYLKNSFNLIRRKIVSGTNYKIFHRYCVPPPPLIRPIHLIGLAVLIFVLYVVSIIVTLVSNIFFPKQSHV